MIIRPNFLEMAQIRSAERFETARDVALGILRRVCAAAQSWPVAMVCGPISSGGYGTLEKNLAVFSSYVKKVSDDGQLVFSQLPFEDTFFRIIRTPYYQGGFHLLETFYGPLFESGMIRSLHFIPRWPTSRGACWEHEKGKALGLEIVYL